WKVGDPINFSGSATDPEDGTEPASRLSWTIILHHCFTPDNCHTHIVQTFNGVASGTFNAPDHEYPCWLEIQLTATDSTGATATTYTANFVQQTTGTFGTTTVGSSVDSASINLKEVSRYTAVASNVTKLTGYISGLGAASGSQKVKAILYADNGSGHPGARLGVSNEVTVN